MIKFKVLKFIICTPKKDDDAVSSNQITDALNDFCAERDVVDVKVTSTATFRHNNGGCDQVELWYTVLYRE